MTTLKISPHHAAWLAAHPERTLDWLKARLSDGFDVHHIDGKNWNNSPENLILIEHLDHMRLHDAEHLAIARRSLTDIARQNRAEGKSVRRKKKGPKQYKHTLPPIDAPVIDWNTFVSPAMKAAQEAREKDDEIRRLKKRLAAQKYYKAKRARQAVAA